MPKGKARGNGQGSIYQRAGRRGYFAAITLNGRRKVFHADTKAEVDRMLSAAKVAKEQGTLVVAPSQTVETYLRGWLEDEVKPDKRPGTYTSYEHLLRLHAYPHIGKIRLDKLTPAQVQAMLNAERAGLSPRTVQYLRAVVSKALDRAWRMELVSRNVARQTDAPKVTRAKIKPLTRDELVAFRAAVAGDRLEALYVVAVSLGLRQGEALGLRWQDVQLDSLPSIRIASQLQRVGGELALTELKTESSRRAIALPAPVAEQLRQHRGRQIEERLAAGSRWKGVEPTDPAGFVFTTAIGTPIEARNLVRSFKALLVRAGLRDFRFHDLRHSAATFMLLQGVAAKTVQEVLGHSQYHVTMDTYGHVLDELRIDAAERMGALFASL